MVGEYQAVLGHTNYLYFYSRPSDVVGGKMEIVIT